MKTKGSRNPNWSREETILALNLLRELDGKMPSLSDECILELSRLLRTNPLPSGLPIKSSFRNAAGIMFKLGNLVSAGGSSGADNNSQLDRAAITELVQDRPENRIESP